MRKVQKILTGVFLSGILLGGIGTGIALVEYSSLAYGGEKRIGEENLVTKELDYVFDPEKERINILGNYWTKSIEVDESVPTGTVRYEVTYNEKRVEPDLCFWEASADEREDWAPLWQEQQADEEIGQGAVPDGEGKQEEGSRKEGSQEEGDREEESQEEGDLREKGENQEEEIDAGRKNESNRIPADNGHRGIRQTCLKFALDDLSGDFALLMEYKDDILTALKQKQIYSYDVLYITDVKIKINPETMPYVRSNNEKYSLN